MTNRDTFWPSIVKVGAAWRLPPEWAEADAGRRAVAESMHEAVRDMLALAADVATIAEGSPLPWNEDAGRDLALWLLDELEGIAEHAAGADMPTLVNTWRSVRSEFTRRSRELMASAVATFEANAEASV
jgi:hypothetical protein